MAKVLTLIIRQFISHVLISKTNMIYEIWIHFENKPLKCKNYLQKSLYIVTQSKYFLWSEFKWQTFHFVYVFLFSFWKEISLVQNLCYYLGDQPVLIQMCTFWLMFFFHSNFKITSSKMEEIVNKWKYFLKIWNV